MVYKPSKSSFQPNPRPNRGHDRRPGVQPPEGPGPTEGAELRGAAGRGRAQVCELREGNLLPSLETSVEGGKGRSFSYLYIFMCHYVMGYATVLFFWSGSSSRVTSLLIHPKGWDDSGNCHRMGWPEAHRRRRMGGEWMEFDGLMVVSFWLQENAEWTDKNRSTVDKLHCNITERIPNWPSIQKRIQKKRSQKKPLKEALRNVEISL